jgi:N-acetyl-anhydromuramyl-L-alanine amidase AmpD
VTRAIIVRGEPVFCAADVRVWSETGLRFPARGKRTETRAVVWHWTGGEGGGEQVHRVLTSRGLSVHFLVDQAGVVWQYADADAYCSHAKGANGWSCGVEISNRANGRAEHPRWPRQVTSERIHDRQMRVTRFLPAQVTAALALADALSRAYDLPRSVPTHPGGDLVTGELGGLERHAFSGHMGHYHLTTEKNDPGTVLMREFATAWSGADS